MASSITDGATTLSPELTTGYRSARPVRHVEHPVVGSPDIAVTLRPAGSRTGTLELLFLTSAEAFAAEALLSTSQAITYVEDDLGTLGMVFVPRGSIDVTLDEETRDRWLVRFDFTEVTP